MSETLLQFRRYIDLITPMIRRADFSPKPNRQRPCRWSAA
jgi:hypothetical protein